MAATLTRSPAHPTDAPRDHISPAPNFSATTAFVAALEKTAPTKSGEKQELIVDRRLPILVAYLLIGLESGLRLIQPLVLGLAINDLLASSYRGLLLFAGQHLAYMLIGTVRQTFVARVFNSLELSLTRTLYSGTVAGEVSSAERQIARIRRFVDVRAISVPLLIQAGVSIIGAVVMLGFYDVMLVPLCLLFLVPVGLLNAAYGRQASRTITRWTTAEREQSLPNDSQSLLAYVSSLNHRRAALADAEASRFALLELFVLGLLATSLVHYCLHGFGLTGGPIQAGDIFAVLGYLLMFLASLDAFPTAIAVTMGRDKSP